MINKNDEKINNILIDKDTALSINHELYKKNAELAVKNKIFELLYELYDITTHTLHLQDLARRLVFSIHKKLNLEFVSIFHFDEENKNLYPIALTTSQKLKKLFSPFEDDFAKIILSSDEDNIVVNSFSKDTMIETKKFFKIFQPYFTELEIKSIQLEADIKTTLIYPLLLEEKKIGVIVLSLNREFKDLNDFEKASLINLVDVVTISLDKSMVYDDLREANTKLTQLDQAKSEFMSIASHQLRTPLAGISGYLSMMMDGDYGEINPEQKPVLRDILNASQRLARIVNVFLNVTRIEAGRFVMNFSKAPFFSVIEDIYKELKPTAEKKGVQLTLEPAELPEVEADIDKMKDVILNLIDNAIKYSPEGSVHVTAKANKRTVHVQVKDTGVGIEPNEAKNLFSKFVRGSGIAQVQPDGSGLGLYIAKRVIEGHGGKIWVESEGAGKGSVFHFEIPIVADPESVKKTEEFQARAKKE